MSDLEPQKKIDYMAEMLRMSTHKVDYKATLLKWMGASAKFRLNMTDVARRSGVTRQHISNIMAGRTVPSMLVAERIDKAVEECVKERNDASDAIALAAVRKEYGHES